MYHTLNWLILPRYLVTNGPISFILNSPEHSRMICRLAFGRHQWRRHSKKTAYRCLMWFVLFGRNYHFPTESCFWSESSPKLCWLKLSTDLCSKTWKKLILKGKLFMYKASSSITQSQLLQQGLHIYKRWTSYISFSQRNIFFFPR